MIRKEQNGSAMKSYTKAYPFLFWFSIGICTTGVVSILFPHLSEQTATSIALSDTLELVFKLMWTIGGGMVTYSLIKCKSNVEAAGLVLIGTGILSYFLSIIYIRPENALNGVFLLFLAIGCFMRVRRLGHLTNNG